MPIALVKTSLFLADYREIVTYLCQANPDAAEQFCDAVEEALQLLSEHPRIGRYARFPHAPDTRRWVIQPFPNYLIYYQDQANGLLLIRLLHGARLASNLIPAS